ncbi:MAG TPA: ATP-binding protein [Flavitalea sp.]|nr:ATP-binding protein [Flavitalea sp.]
MDTIIIGETQGFRKPVNELDYVHELIKFRLAEYFNPTDDLTEPPLPELDQWSLPMADYIKHKTLPPDLTKILLIALMPHIRPDLFDNVIEESLKKAGDFPKLGGARGKSFRGFLPTGETAIFLLGGSSLQRRFEIQDYFNAEQFFAKEKVLLLEDVPQGEPLMSGKLVLSQEFVDLFTMNKISRPHFSASFPARFIQTELEWDDLVLNDEAMTQIKELETWINHNEQLMNGWGMRNRLKPGYRILFHGPPGTGKTFTATLLGKYTGRDVFRIDLSMVVSKYIGETEKNLENLFAKAEAKKWILFFDEADAIFGKRTNVRDAHDKYANQEVSYLLQRIEDFDGMVILASNMKANIDESFIRRFNAMIRFSLPDENERLILWRKTFPSHISFYKEEDIPDIVKKVELTGGNINNIVQYACLKAVEKSNFNIYLDDVVNGIKRELHKEGKPFTGII